MCSGSCAEFGVWVVHSLWGIECRKLRSTVTLETPDVSVMSVISIFGQCFSMWLLPWRGDACSVQAVVWVMSVISKLWHCLASVMHASDRQIYYVGFHCVSAVGCYSEGCYFLLTCSGTAGGSLKVFSVQRSPIWNNQMQNRFQKRKRKASRTTTLRYIVKAERETVRDRLWWDLIRGQLSCIGSRDSSFNHNTVPADICID